MPSTPADTYGLLRAAIQDPNPVVFIENRLLYGMKGPQPPADHILPIGTSAVVRPGTDVTVVSVSRMVHEAVAAAEVLAGEGISVEVIDLRTVAPLDMAPILESVHKTSRLLIAHEAVVPFGIGAEIAATVARDGFWDLDAPIERIGAAPTPPPYAPDLERAWLPDRDDIADGDPPPRRRVSSAARARARSRGAGSRWCPRRSRAPWRRSRSAPPVTRACSRGRRGSGPPPTPPTSARRLAFSFAIAASLRNGCPVSRSDAARYVSQRAASSSVAMSASLNWIAWNFEIGWPNCTRCLGVVGRQVEHGLGEAERQRGDRDAPDLERAQELAEAHRGIADEVVVGDPHVVEEQLAGVEAPPADAAHLRAHREAGRVLLDDEARERRPAVLGRLGAGEQRHAERHVGAGVGDERLATVDQPAAVAPLGARADAARVGTGVGLGQAERAERRVPRPAVAASARAARRCRTGTAAANRSSRAPATRPPPTGRPGRVCSIAATKPTVDMPMPPHSSGISMPSRPSAPISRSRSVGHRASSHASGRTRRDLLLRELAAQVDQVAFRLGEREVHAPDPIGPTGTTAASPVAVTDYDAIDFFRDNELRRRPVPVLRLAARAVPGAARAAPRRGDGDRVRRSDRRLQRHRRRSRRATR